MRHTPHTRSPLVVSVGGESGSRATVAGADSLRPFPRLMRSPAPDPLAARSHVPLGERIASEIGRGSGAGNEKRDNTDEMRGREGKERGAGE